MSKLTSLVPWYYRLLAVVLLSGSVWIHGYTKGLKHGQDELDAYKNQIETATARQEGRTFQIVQANNKAKGDIEDAYNQSILAIRQYYDQQLRQSRGKVTINVPPDSQTAKGTNDSSGPCLDQDTTRRLAAALLQIKANNDYWKHLCLWNDCQ